MGGVKIVVRARSRRWILQFKFTALRKEERKKEREKEAQGLSLLRNAPH